MVLDQSFERDCNHNVQFEETKFPKASDYGEPPVDTYDHSRQRWHQLPLLLQASLKLGIPNITNFS